MIAAYAVQAHVCYIYIRGEYFIDGEKLQAAIDEAYKKNLIGKNIADTTSILQCINFINKFGKWNFKKNLYDIIF